MIFMFLAPLNLLSVCLCVLLRGSLLCCKPVQKLCICFHSIMFSILYLLQLLCALGNFSIQLLGDHQSEEGSLILR